MNDVIGEVRSRLSVSRPLLEPNAGMSPAAKKFALILLIPIVCVGAALAFGDQQVAIALTGLFAMLGIVVSLVGLFSRRLRGMFGKIAVCSFLLLIGAMVMSPNKVQNKTLSPSMEPKTASSYTSSVSALDKMAVAFKGGYSRDQIDDLLSRVMSRFGEPLTEANYARWGNVLIALRKSNHQVSEVEILRCMRVMDPSFRLVGAAALCATAVQNGL